jgi:quaternary ammonium compound-resistance protein SugE
VTPRSAAWPLLLVSGVLEAVWATAMGASHGFTRPAPTGVFLVAVALSTAGLGLAMRHIPAGTAYAVWTAIGTVLTVAWGIVGGTQPAEPLTLVFLAGVIACVAGLHAVEAREARPAPPS